MKLSTSVARVGDSQSFIVGAVHYQLGAALKETFDYGWLVTGKPANDETDSL